MNDAEELQKKLDLLSVCGSKKHQTLEESLVSLQKLIGKPLSEIVYYNRLSLKEKMDFIENLYQNAKKDMKDPMCEDNPNKKWVVNTHIRGSNIEESKKLQKHSCLCCGIGITEKYNYCSYLLKPHRIVYEFLRGDYVIPNIVMLCYKCHDKEFGHWTENKKRLKTIKTIQLKNGGTIPREVPFSWDELVDISFEIFKEFIIKNHENVDKEIENMIFQDIENEVELGVN
jgi:hypothetical protein